MRNKRQTFKVNYNGRRYIRQITNSRDLIGRYQVRITFAYVGALNRTWPHIIDYRIR